MIIQKQARERGICLCIALLCIAALVMTVSAATSRTVPGNVQLVAVNVSPQVTPGVPAAGRITVVTTPPVLQRVVIVTTVTTIPVVNKPRIIPGVTIPTTQPTLQLVVVQPRSANTTLIDNGTIPGPNVISVENRQVIAMNPAEITGEDRKETTGGVQNPKTGEVLSPDTPPGSGLTGGDFGNKMPSGEDQWNNRFGNAGAGDVTSGTPFDSNPLSNPMDGFFNQFGGNLPDPLSAYGSGRSGISPAEAGSNGFGGEVVEGSSSTPGTNGFGGEVVEGSSSTPGTNGFGGEVVEGSSSTPGTNGFGGEVVGTSSSSSGAAGGKAADGGNSGFRLPGTNKYYYFEYDQSGSSGSHDQQYEGEGGYAGGTGHSANDLTVGSTGRMTGNGVGGTDPGDAGLGKDTGGKTPALFVAIEKYMAQGGKVRGVKGGYQPGDSGQGQDIGGTSEGRIFGLKNALGARRFIIDPDATYAEQVPWWMEKVVSPGEQTGAAQVNAVQEGAAKADAGNAAAGQVK